MLPEGVKQLSFSTSFLSSQSKTTRRNFAPEPTIEVGTIFCPFVMEYFLLEILLILKAFVLSIVAFPVSMEWTGSVEIELSTHALEGLSFQGSTMYSSSAQFELTFLSESTEFEDTMISP